MEDKKRPAASPQEVRNTIEWLIQIEDFAQARSLAFTLVKFLPKEHPETSDFMAMVLHRTKHYPEAVQWAEETIKLAPNSLEALYNLARCLHSAGHTAQAEIEIRKVLEKRPDWVDPQLDLAMYICSLGRAQESKAILLKLREVLEPSDPQQQVITYNMGWHLLQAGKFQEGMKALAVGRKLRVFGAHAGVYPKPKLFKGLPLKDKRVLLVGEAGAGDEIVNVRFAKILHDQGAHVTWMTNQKMESLFSRAPGVDKVIATQEVAASSYDYWAPTMDVATLLEISEEALPKAAYLSPHTEFLTKWKAKIPEKGRLKVGLRWQGNPLYEQDLFRSVPFQLFREHILSKDIDFYSIQRDTGLEEMQPDDGVKDLSQDLQTWEDTAAAICCLDVVITSCTSIAHLAGALGKKTFVFTPMISYFVWASPGEKAIWYQDVHLFRQKNFHDWTSEAKEIGDRLKKLIKEKA